MAVLSLSLILAVIVILLGLVPCTNAQDTDPMFPTDQYEVTCEENTAIGTVILSLTATDPDPGPSGQLYYTMDDNDWFEVNSTGSVKVKAEVDAENPDVNKVMVLVMTATDRGTPPRSGTTTLRIIIADVNEHRPNFNSPLYKADLYGGDPVGTPVLTVQATDRDRDAVLIYDFPLPIPYLNIDNRTGEITVHQVIDYDAIILVSEGAETIRIQPRVNDTKFLVFGNILTTLYRARPTTTTTPTPRPATTNMTTNGTDSSDPAIYETSETCTTDKYLVTFSAVGLMCILIIVICVVRYRSQHKTG